MNTNQTIQPALTAGSILKSVGMLMVVTVAISGCSRMATGPSFPSNPFEQQTVAAPQPTVTASPVARLEQQASGLNVSGYVDSAALQAMTPKDKTQASSAQFYALQFGRPGAPRNWSGDAGTTGEVTVGPFVRSNNLDCREYSHKVTISGTSYTREGTSCRNSNGDWNSAGTG